MNSQNLTKKSERNGIVMEKTGKTILEEIQGTVDEIIKQVRKLIKEGNARRIVIKNKHDRILFQSQLTIGAAGITLFAMMAPIITAISTLMLLANDVKVLVERDIQEDDDEYEVEAEIVEIEEDEEEEDENPAKGDEGDSSEKE